MTRITYIFMALLLLAIGFMAGQASVGDANPGLSGRYHISGAGEDTAYKIDTVTGQVWIVLPNGLREVKNNNALD